MKRFAYLLWPAGALLFQPVGLLVLWVLSWSAYCPWFPGYPIWAVSVAGMLLLAVAHLALGAVGAYQVLTRARRSAGVLLTVFCCFPALVMGAMYLRAALVFLTVV